MEGPAGEEVIPSAPDRRKVLIAEMQDRAQRGHGCSTCNGICCTYLSNSMQITPVEAMDLKNWLQEQGRWDEALLQNLRDCVAKFRLDQDLGDGRRSLRRTYTCPFFRNGPLGCSISPHHKPYGCLAFNARSPDITQGGDCASDQALLLKQQSSSAEDGLNRTLKTQYKLTYDKAPIPVILLAL